MDLASPKIAPLSEVHTLRVDSPAMVLIIRDLSKSHNKTAHTSNVPRILHGFKGALTVITILLNPNDHSLDQKTCRLLTRIMCRCSAVSHYA